jgi:Tfp pilus assembly protein PilV
MKELKSAVTLYAQWEKNQYTITYNANGGSNPPTSQTKTHETTLTLTSAIPTSPAASKTIITLTYAANGGSSTPSSQTGTVTIPKVFDSWNTKADGSGVKYASGASYTADTSVTLYA